MSKVGKLISEWDESKIIEEEIKYQLEESKEELQSGETTEEEIENSVYEDSYIMEVHYDSFIEDLNFILNKKNPNGYWKAQVKNFGWRGLDGENIFHTYNAQFLLDKILPKTQCTFKIYNYGRGIAIQNFHHDSPTGNEWYYITPIKETTYEKMR